jgi:NAD(P)-dependent dehydrogenase (short-subunit alcohol dehydrogenase family)
MELNGVVAVVTGGASGLGLATTHALVSQGAHVVVLDRDEEKARKLAEALGDKVTVSITDVTDRKEIESTLGSIASDLPLRVAVNCAGIGVAKRVLSRDGAPHDVESFSKVIQVNLIGTFNVMAVAASIMAKTDPLEFGERGVVVNTASIAAFDGQIGQIAYSASKGGIVGMTLPAARDLAVVGVRVVTIAPGIIDTPLLGSLPEEARAALAAGVPFPHRLGTPEDYAKLVLSICDNGYINGEVIRLDGALRMAPK